MTRIANLQAAAIAALIVSLSGAAWAAQRMPAGLPASAALLLRYDADHDGIITRAEMEAGLKADFAAADMNGDGCLDPAEVRAENQARLTRDGAEASPLVDWNLDGCVDAREFGNTVHSYFDLADKTKDGKVSMVELRGPSAPLGPRTGAAVRTGMDSAGSTTQTPTNPATGLPY
jgi:Ca2+-binding EF-hand superfamily protein